MCLLSLCILNVYICLCLCALVRIAVIYANIHLQSEASPLTGLTVQQKKFGLHPKEKLRKNEGAATKCTVTVFFFSQTNSRGCCKWNAMQQKLKHQLWWWSMAASVVSMETYFVWVEERATPQAHLFICAADLLFFWLDWSFLSVLSTNKEGESDVVHESWITQNLSLVSSHLND